MNEDLGAECWTTRAGLATDDPASIISLTATIFPSDGSKPSFVIAFRGAGAGWA